MSQISNRTSILPARPQPPLNGNDEPAPLDAHGKISWEAFMEWVDEDTHAEWVDGEIEMSSPASFRHQHINKFLTAVLSIYVEMTNCGVDIQGEFMMRLPNIPRGRAPDWIFLRNEHANRLQDNFVNGSADVVLEIISPESRIRDTQTKLSEYRIGGIPEYWLIDPIQNIAWFYQLQPTGQYQEMPLDQQGRYFSAQIDGFWLRPDWLWQQTLPEINRVMFQIAGTAYSTYLMQKAAEEGVNFPPNA
jgi:Uma2 family endonuclease